MSLIIECYLPSLTRYYCYTFSFRESQCCSRSRSRLSFCPVVDFPRCTTPSTRIHAFLVVQRPRRRNGSFYTAFPFPAVAFSRLTSLTAGFACGGGAARLLIRSRASTAASTHGIGRSVFDDELTPIEAVVLRVYQSGRCMFRTREIDKREPSVGEHRYLRYRNNAYPLHRPLSSNVPIRIFRIQGSCGASTLTSSPVGSGAFLGCARCASKRPLIESTVVLNPRLPKKSVGAGGCFCVDSIFRANGVRLFPASSPVILGRPSKLSPRGEGGYSANRSEE
jgi:hypothetical protein